MLAWLRPTRLVRAMRVLQTTFESPGLRRMLAGSAGAYLGLWAFTVLFAIYAYDEGGAAAVGVAALVRQLPAGLLAPWIAVFADRYPRRRVLVASGAAQAVLMAAVGIAVALHGPYAAVLALAALTTAAAAPFRPAQFALIPQLAGTPTQVAAANVVWGVVEYAGFLGGSLAAALLVALGLAAALPACAAAIALGTLVLLGLPRVGGADPEPVAVSAWAELSAGLRTVRADAQMRLLTGVRGVDAAVQGAVDVLLVACAIELLGTGQSGVGVLSSAWGVGGVAGGGLALSLLSRGRLASGVSLGCVLAGIPLVVIALWAAPVPALLLLVVLGGGFAVLESALNTLLQRRASDTVLARVFGVNEGVYVLGTALGSILAAALLSVLGVEGALVTVGLALPVLALALRRRFSRMEAGIEVPERAYALLRGLEMFAPLPIATLETLAARATFEDLPAGHVLLRQGEPGQTFYVLDQGELDVFVDGRHVDERHSGECFGEIALLRAQPRMATVQAVGDARVLALGRQEFLGAVGSHERSVHAADRLADERTARAADRLVDERAEGTLPVSSDTP